MGLKIRTEITSQGIKEQYIIYNTLTGKTLSKRQLFDLSHPLSFAHMYMDEHIPEFPESNYYILIFLDITT